MAHDVFISHSAKDKTIADAVCAMLESEGIRCWIAPRDVTPGMEWGKCIIDAIKQARVMLLVFTANANASPQIRREVERAVNHDVVILPFRVENVLPDESLEYFIGNVHWLDALTPPMEAHLKNLAKTIKVLLAQMGTRDGSVVLHSELDTADAEFEEAAAPHIEQLSAAARVASAGVEGPPPAKRAAVDAEAAVFESAEGPPSARAPGPGVTARKPWIRRRWVVVALGAVVLGCVAFAAYHGLRSRVAGTKWVVRSSGTGQDLNSIFATSDGGHVWAVGGKGTILESDDRGATWTARNSGTINDLNSIFGTGDGRRLWAVGGKGTILESADGGTSWTALDSGITKDLTSIFGTSDGRHLWVLDPDEGAIVKSDDWGSSWTEDKFDTGQNLDSILGNPDSIFGTSDGKHLWVVGMNLKSFESDDGGATWTARNSAILNKDDPPSSFFMPVSIFGTNDGGHVWVVGGGGQGNGSAATLASSIRESNDGGATWTAPNSGPTNFLYSIFGTGNGKHLWAVGFNGAIVESDDSGSSWTARDSGTANHLHSIFGTRDGKHLWAVGEKGTILESDSGV
jgi:photosystem II stability/assembly factor-like uncharacterized protein